MKDFTIKEYYHDLKNEHHNHTDSFHNDCSSCKSELRLSKGVELDVYDLQVLTEDKRREEADQRDTSFKIEENW